MNKKKLSERKGTLIGTLIKIPLSLVILLVILLITDVNIKIVSALPPFPTEFYGTVTFYNEPADIGSLIRAVYGEEDNECGTFTTMNLGYFGLLSCKGDDSLTLEVEGPLAGETINFYLSDRKASVYGNNSWEEGTFKFLEIVIPEVVCGDNFCDLKESCATCPEDCGLCNQTGGNFTGNQTGEGTGSGDGTGGDIGDSGEGTGTGSGGSGGSSSTSSFSVGTIYGDQYAYDAFQDFGCVENWVCGNWSECPPSEIQTRTCTDLNNCGSFFRKPAEKQSCIYEEELWDEPEEDEDETKIPRKETPLSFATPEIVCHKEINPLKNDGIWFFLFIILIIALKIYQLEHHIETIRKKKQVDDIKKAKQIYSAKRKAYIFISVMIFFAIILYIFYVFFFLCEFNMPAFIIMLIGISVIPFILHLIIRFFEYHEHDKFLKLSQASDTHYMHLKSLIEIQSEHIKEMEQEIGELFYELSKNDSFKKVLETWPELEIVYHELMKLYKDHEHIKEVLKHENNIIESIYGLANKEEFVTLSEKVPDIKVVYEKLSLLYQHYAQRQELYKELVKAENEMNQSLEHHLEPSQ